MWMYMNIENTIADYVAVAKTLEEKEYSEWKAFENEELFPNIQEIFIDKSKRNTPKNLLIITTRKDEDDVINLQYAIALMSRFKNLYIYLLPNDDFKSYHKFSHFLCIIIQEFDFHKRICSTYKDKEGNLIHAPLSKQISFGGKERVLHKFSPLIKLDERYFDFSTSEVIPWASSVARFHKQKSFASQWFFAQCRELFGRKLKKRTEYFDGNEFKKITKNMSVVSFYLLCFIYHNRTNKEWGFTGDLSVENDSYYQLNQDILFTREISEGFLQLMENSVIHTDNQCGFVCFRIHSKPNNSYLQEKYPHYKDDDDLHLEMLLIDYSTAHSIPEKFVYNVLGRITDKDEPEDVRCKLRKLQESYKDILNVNNTSFKLKSFFSPEKNEEKFWDEYNAIGTNVAHHYGVQIFDSTTVNTGAIFRAISSKKYKAQSDEIYLNGFSDQFSGIKDPIPHLPGSEFSILISLEPRDYTQKMVSVNANINYINELKKNYKAFDLSSMCPMDSKSIKKLLNDIPSQPSHKRKEKLIYAFSKEIDKVINTPLRFEEGKSVLYYSAEKIDPLRIEIFCKALVVVISQSPEKKFNLMITECSNDMMFELLRLFFLFFNKSGNSSIFNNCQIYLKGSGRSDDFILAGNNLSQIYARAQKLAFARCVDSRISKLIASLLGHRINVAQSSEASKDIDLISFDMVPLPTSGKTLFESDVEETLAHPITDEEFGCHHSNTHVRVGSKIHLNDFFEAELLFHNKYYVARFARLISDRLSQSLNALTVPQKIMLVGYETYSESLLYTVKEAVKEEISGMDVEYIIYDQKNTRFSYFNLNKNYYDNASFVLIVPINSTLTTHNKLKEKLLEALNKEPNVIANYAVILIQHSGLCVDSKGTVYDEYSKEFWELYHERECKITTREHMRIVPDVEFFIRIKAEWHLPLKCPFCVPTENQLLERPLVETNRESIVPMQKISLNKKKYKTSGQKDLFLSKDNMKRLKALGPYTRYSHSSEGENHYLFYFKYEDYYMAEKINIEDWLEQVSKELDTETDEMPVFNIIAAPLNRNNTGFIESFSQKVFQQPALILRIDASKEYRENIRTKYQHIALLYSNIQRSGGKGKIRFHFVDSTIYSGKVISRMESILRSIFPKEAIDEGIVSIFYSITVLANRISDSTKLNYLDDISRYYAYVNIDISPMRVHDDACTLCKLLSDYSALERYSASNIVSQAWKNKIKKHRCRDILDFYSPRKEKGGVNMDNTFDLLPEEINKGALRLIHAHLAMSVLSRVADIVSLQNSIIGLMNKSNAKTSNFVESLISYIKVISRPFVVFDQDIKAAIFKLMLYIMEYILYEDVSRINRAIDEDNAQRNDIQKFKENIEKLFDKIKGLSYQEKHDVAITLINRLADMGANYLIDVHTITQLFLFADRFDKDIETSAELRKIKKLKEKLLTNYILAIKRMVTVSSDEIPSLRLEESIFNISLREELNEKLKLLRNENTLILKDSINDLYFKDKKLADENFLLSVEDSNKSEKAVDDSFIEELNRYYYRSFKNVFEINKINFDESVERINFAVSLYKRLKERINDHNVDKKSGFKNYYATLVGLIMKVTGANSVSIFLDNNYLVGKIESDKEAEGSVIEFNSEMPGQMNHKISIYLKYPDSIKRNMRTFFERFILMCRYEFVSVLERDYASGVLVDFYEQSRTLAVLESMSTWDHGNVKEDMTNGLEYIVSGFKKERELSVLANSYLFQIANHRLTHYYRKIVSQKPLKFSWKSYPGNEFHLFPVISNTGIQYADTNNIKIQCCIEISEEDLNSRQPCFLRYEFDTELLMILQVFNAAKYGAKKEGKIQIQILFEDEYIIIKNPWGISKENAEEEITKIRERLVMQLPQEHLTLWVINYICQQFTGKQIQVNYEDNEMDHTIEFILKLPLLQEEK